MVDKLQEIFKNFFDIYNIKDEPKRQEVDKKRKSQKDLIEGIYIFVSFDLINSTIFKSRHKKIWAAFVSSFYESVSSNFGLNTGTLVERNDEINNTTDRRPFGNYTFREYTTEIAKTNGFHLWKLLGDEVLFYED